MNTVNNLYEFMEERGFGEKTVEDIQRMTYKYTDCGAWVSFEGRSIEEYDCKGLEPQLINDPLYNSGGMVIIGSIVEGADYETGTYILKFPFVLQEFWDALDNVEMEAKQIWDELNIGEE